MANQQHVQMLLRDGVEAWNKWREETPDIRPDLFRASLSEVDLRKANLSAANLDGADLSEANLFGAALHGAQLFRANLDGAVLSEANLFEANLSGADLRAANLRMAYLNGANLRKANLSEANLSRADLFGANLFGVNCVYANFSGATLTGCNVYGVSAWDVNLDGAVQVDLRISLRKEDSQITVDNLEVAQFLYLLLHNEKMRTILDTITSKVVLILGRFSDERKPVLDALREALRRHPNGYVPVLFDFEPQTDRPILETVKTLANLARFVIADLTDPHMIRAELTAIIPNVPTVPVQSIIEGNADLPTEYESWALYKSFLPVYRYIDLSHLLANLTESVITPVEAHVQARRL